MHEDLDIERRGARRPAQGRLRGRARAARTSSSRGGFLYDRGASAAIENRAIVAQWDAQAEELTIWDTTQAPIPIRNGLAAHARAARIAGARRRAVRRRRLRPEDHDVLPGGAARALGGDAARPAAQVDRGSPGELLRDDAGARAGARRGDGADAGRPDPRRPRRLPVRHRRLRSVRPDDSDQHAVHAARPVRHRELRQRVHGGLHEQADRHAGARRRPPARRVRQRAAARSSRRRSSASIASRSGKRNLLGARSVPAQPRDHVPGLGAAHLRQRQLPADARAGRRDDRLRAVPAREQAAAARRGPARRRRHRLLRRGHRHRSVRRRARHGRAERHGARRDRRRHAGTGALHRLRADRGRRARRGRQGRHGRHRRHARVPVGHRHVRQPRRGRRRQRVSRRRAAGAREDPGAGRASCSKRAGRQLGAARTAGRSSATRPTAGSRSAIWRARPIRCAARSARAPSPDSRARPTSARIAAARRAASTR